MSEQQSPEWFARRCGKFTGSRFADVMAMNKRTGAPLKSYNDLIWQIVVERLTGEPTEGVDSYSLRWGRDLEDFARQEYELVTGNAVEQIDFIDHPLFSFVGCSPDGLIGDEAGLEIKCPKSSAIHLQRFLSGVPDEYVPQIQGGMWVTGRKRWDFVSYDPRFQESHRLLVIQVDRDDEYIKQLEMAVLQAEKTAVGLLEQLTKKAA